MSARPASKSRVETERDFGRWFEDWLTLRGYRWIHFTPSMAFSGRVVTSQRGSRGWPDYAITGKGRFLLAELKTDAKYLNRDQKAWAEDLAEAGVDVYCWRPKDRERIMKELP